MATTIKITKEQLEGVLQGLSDVAANRLPGTMSLKVFEMKQQVAHLWEPVAETRNNLVVKHGTPGPRGPEIRDDSPNYDAFLDDWQPVAEQEVEIEVQPIDLSELVKHGDFRPDSLGVLSHVGILTNASTNGDGG